MPFMTRKVYTAEEIAERQRQDAESAREIARNVLVIYSPEEVEEFDRQHPAPGTENHPDLAQQVENVGGIAAPAGLPNRGSTLPKDFWFWLSMTLFPFTAIGSTIAVFFAVVDDGTHAWNGISSGITIVAFGLNIFVLLYYQSKRRRRRRRFKKTTAIELAELRYQATSLGSLPNNQAPKMEPREAGFVPASLQPIPLQTLPKRRAAPIPLMLPQLSLPEAASSSSPRENRPRPARLPGIRRSSGLPVLPSPPSSPVHQRKPTPLVHPVFGGV